MTVSIANNFATLPASPKSNHNSSKGCEGVNALDDFSKILMAKFEVSIARAEKKAQIFTHPAMNLFTQTQLLKLQKNFSINNEIVQHSPDTIDFEPVVKLFTPDGACTWLLSELGPDLIAFGLCDLGFGEPEMGYVSLEKIYALRGKMGLPVERDRGFEANKTLSEYAMLARKDGRITA